MQHWNWTKNGSLTIQSLNCPCSHWARKLCKQCVRNSKTLWWRMPLRSDSQKARFIQGPILAKLSTFCEMMRLIAAEVNLIMYKCAIDNPDLWDFEICHHIMKYLSHQSYYCVAGSIWFQWLVVCFITFFVCKIIALSTQLALTLAISALLIFLICAKFLKIAQIEWLAVSKSKGSGWISSKCFDHILPTSQYFKYCSTI